MNSRITLNGLITWQATTYCFIVCKIWQTLEGLMIHKQREVNESCWLNPFGLEKGLMLQNVAFRYAATLEG